jgi:hypothetical protein
MIQNDLTHGWGLDLTWHNCAVDPAKVGAEPCLASTPVTSEIPGSLLHACSFNKLPVGTGKQAVLNRYPRCMVSG